MIEDKIAFISNFFWKKSVENINSILSIDQTNSFNMNDYYYLTVISQLKTPNLGDIAKELRLTRPAISAMARRLIKNGLVEKVQSLQDKRIFHIMLTEKGIKIIQGDYTLYTDLANEVEELLSQDQLAEIDGLLTALVTQIVKKQHDNKDQI